MVETGAGGMSRIDLSKIAEDLIPAETNIYNLGASDKQWAAIWVAIAMVTSLTIGGVIGLSNVDSWLYINSSTWVNGSMNISENLFVDGNITANYYYGDGSNLSNVNFTESDPLWTANQSSYSTTAMILSWNYYNSTDFDISDYLNLSTLLSFNYYNSTDFDITDYLNLSTLLSFNYYNSTDFSIADYFTSAEILDFSYYNSTDFSIADYLDLAQNNWFNDSNYWLNWDGDSLEFNESKLEILYFNASTIEVITGTGAGNLEDIQTYNRITYNVTEDNSDFELRVNFTGITEFTTLLVRHKSDVEAGHLAAIQIWDYVDEVWEGYGYLTERTTSTIKTIGVYDYTDHIDGGVVQVRFYQDEGPPNTAHVHQFDWVSLSKGFGTPIGQEIDPYWASEKADYLLAATILGFNYYNSTDFDITDYFTSAEVLGFNYYNSTNPQTELDPLWTGNSTLVPYLASANTFTAGQNLTGQNITAINCIIFDSGGKICSGV